jgi:hypothetical protein
MDTLHAAKFRASQNERGDVAIAPLLDYTSAFFFAKRSQVSTTVSGFSDTDSIP